MKEKFNYREAYERLAAIHDRLEEMGDTIKREDRVPSAAESAEQRDLERDLNYWKCKILANTANIPVNAREDVADANKQIRECLDAGKRFEVKISRAIAADFGGDTSGYLDPASSTNPAPVTIGDIVAPLIPKTILGAIGAPLLTGLSGNYMYPVVEAFDVTINDEGAALGDTKIPVNKLYAKPERLGVAVPITREALTETGNLLQTVCTEYIPVALAALMNKIMFSTEKVTGATNLVGPFVNLADDHKITGDLTLANVNKLKGVVLNSDVQPEQLCFVCNHNTLGLLESTPKWEGALEAIVVDGKINGLPIFATSLVADNVIYFGAWKYAPQGIFGDISFIVDPYTQARKNAVDFVLNVDYAITTLREEAFAMLSFQG